MVHGAATRNDASQSLRFALAKFRPTALPATLVRRPALHDRLAAGSGKRLTVMVGSAGAGKSVLLASWATARPPGTTSWLSCDKADVNLVRFWTGFIEALQAVAPGFGADAADLLAMDGDMSADVIASIANDAAKLPAGSAIIVDDFHVASAQVSGTMTDLVERWPAETAQLVLASRTDPPLRLHRLRLSGELCELRDRDLHFSLTESGSLLANFGVEVAADDLALLHRRSEGWAAALQMAALSLRGATDPVRAARALEVRSPTIAEYFVSEVLDYQPPEIVQFMLDTSILGERPRTRAQPSPAGRTPRRCCAELTRPACSWCRSMTSGRASGTTIWCAGCCALSCGPGTGTASRRSSYGQPNGSSAPATHGAGPGISWPPGRLTGPWTSYRTGS